MDKYHIYNEIGKGAFSLVYKGREKKKIEYVAIKRIEKSEMNKIVSEVQVMHKLNSPHVLKFHDWYETRSGLWLILEYCTGGDLAILLEQDDHLPETSIQIFALDILAGLRYLHSLGIVHCDLRAKNFLIDEYGILKISDFKNARTLSKCSIDKSIPLENRGHLAYLAPELLTPDGIFSYASDFWALGCLLHQLRRGFAPFGDRPGDEPSTIIDHIKETDPVHHPISPSAPSITPVFADLLSSLLEKSPVHRCTWNEVVTNSFWGSNANSTSTTLPPHPAFDNLLANMEKLRMSRVEAEIFTQEGLDPSTSRLIDHVDKNGDLSGGGGYHSPSKRDAIAVSVAATPDGNRIVPAPSDSTYKRHVRKESNSQSSSVNGNKPETRIGSSVSSSVATTAVVGAVSGSALSTVPESNRLNPHPGISENGEVEGGLPFQMIPIEKTEEFAACKLVVHPIDQQVKPIVGNKAIEVIDVPPFKGSTLPCKALSADDISKLSQTDLEAHLTQLYKALHKATSSSASSSSSSSGSNEKLNILAYLCTIAPSAEVANVVLNTHFLPLILRLIRPNSSGSSHGHRGGSRMGVSSTASNSSLLAAPAMQARLLATTVLAMMIRFATFILPPNDDKAEHIIPVLISVLREQPRLDVKIRRRALAALGEVVFYISAQGDGDDAHSKEEDPWKLPGGALTIIVKCLREDPDETIRHYAAKLIENVMAQGGKDYKKRLATFDNADRLLDLVMTGRGEGMQLTCLMGTFHILSMVAKLQSAPQSASTLGNTHGGSSRNASNTSTSASLSGARFVSRIVEKGSFLQNMSEMLRDGPPKLQMAYLNMFNLIFCDEMYGQPRAGTTLTNSRNTLAKIKGTVQSIIRLAEHGASSGIRAKALVASQLLFKCYPALMSGLGEKRLPAILVRLLDPISADPKTLIYKSALSMILCIRADLVLASKSLTSYLLQLCSGELSGISTPTDSPTKGSSRQQWGDYTDPDSVFGSSNRRTPNSVVKHRTRTPDNNTGARKPAVPIQSYHQNETTVSPAKEASRNIFNLVERLRIGITLAGQPALRNQIIDAPLILAVAELIRAFMSVCSMKDDSSVTKILSLVQVAVSSILEAIAQIHLQSIDNSLVKCFLQNLIPAICSLSFHHDKDVRVLLSVSLRQLGPTIIRLSIGEAQDENALHDIARHFDDLMNDNLLELLRAEDPIPQYVVRTLTEIVNVSDGFTSLLSEKIENAGLLQGIIQFLEIDSEIARDMYGNINSPTNGHALPDVQLIHLIRTLFDRSSAKGRYISVRRSSQSMLAVSICRMLPLVVHGRNYEIAVALLGMLSSVLHFVLRSLTSKGDDLTPSGELLEMRQLCSPLFSVTCTLFQIMSWRPKESRQSPHRRTSFGDVESSLLSSMHETCSRCLNILFDLYPVAVVGQILDGDDTSRISCDDIMANILVDASLDEKVKVRLLKLLHSMVKLIPSMSTKSSSRLSSFFAKANILDSLQDLLLSGPNRAESVDGEKYDNELSVHMTQSIVDYSKKILIEIKSFQDTQNDK